MSSLIVLCPHCLTWIEPHAQCCPECGGAVDLDDVDPSPERLAERLGEQILCLGPLKLVRRGWPDCGQLVVTTRGLLFVPLLAPQMSGALEAIVVEPPHSTRTTNLLHWWPLPSWRRASEKSTTHPAQQGRASQRSILDLLLDSPGAVFVQQSAIQRIGMRWGRIQVERRPSRALTLTQIADGPGPRDLMHSLTELPDWRDLVSEAG